MCAFEICYLLPGKDDGFRTRIIFMMNGSDWFHVLAIESHKFISAKDLKLSFKWSFLVLKKLNQHIASQKCWVVSCLS